MNTNYKGQSCPFPTDFTIEHELSNFPKAVTRSFGVMVGCRLPANLKKKETAQALADYIKDNIADVLGRCSGWDVKCVNDLVSAGPGVALAMPARTPVSLIEIILGFRMQMDGEQGIRWTAMPDDLREAVGGQAAGLLSDPEFLAHSERMQTLRGLLTLYGYAPLEMVIDRMADFYPEVDDVTLMQLLFEPEFMCGLDPEEMENWEEGNGVFVAGGQVRGVFDNEDDFFAQLRPGLEYKKFSKRQVLLAGQLPLPEFGLPSGERLKQVLQKKCGLTVQEADELLYDLWIDKQDFEGPPTSYIDLVKDRVTFHSFADIQTVMDAVASFINAVPCWALLGNASNEIRPSGPLTRPPQIQIGPNMRKAGIREEEIQQAMDAAFYSDVADSLIYKAGRNDPCPCGSGLKFKNCHGKGN